MPTTYDFQRPYPNIPATVQQMRRVERLWDEAVTDLEILETVEEMVASGQHPALTVEQQQAIFRVKPHATYLYFVYSEQAGLIKIGKTRHPRTRIQCLRTQSPVPLKVVGVIRAHDAHEKMLHDALEESRKHGEWFEPTTELLGLIEKAIEHGIRPVHEFIMRRLAKPETLA